MAVLPEQIHDAQGQRVVRPDDRKVGPVLPGKGAQGGQVFGAQAHALDGPVVGGQALAGDACVAGGAPHPRDTGGLRQLPDQRMFATARTYDENLHAPD